MAYHITNVTMERKKDSSAVITAEVTKDAMEKYRARAIEKLGKQMSVPGFRPGHIPEDVVVKNTSESLIQQEAAELAMTDQYPQLIAQEKLSIIGQPDISITKLGKDEPMAFTITATLLPDITLPDYKAIAKKHLVKRPEESVTPDEVTETLTHLRRERAKIEKMEAGTSPEAAAKESAEMEATALPPIDDTFTKTLGYESAEIFTEKLRENIKNEKANRGHEKARIEMLEELIKETNITVPERLVAAELDNMESQFAHDLSHAGQSLEQYLTDAKKTHETLRKEWEEGAKKRAAMQLIMREIAEKEEIHPDSRQVQEEVQHIVSHTEGANESAVRAYVTSGLRTELVFRLLESIAAEEK